MDSFYYYAPVPRVRKLRKILKHVGVKPTKLLVQDPLIRPDFILDKLTYWIKGDSKPEGVILSIVKCKSLNIVKLSRDREVNDERAAFLDFLIFVLRGDAREADRKLREGICPSRNTVKLGSKVREKLRKLGKGDITTLKDLIPPVKYRRKLAKLCSEFMVCRACKVLSIEYPQSVVRIPFMFQGKNNGKLGNFIKQKARECVNLCELGNHWEDVGRAASLLNYVKTYRNPVYVATLVTLYPKKVREECFSCIMKALASKERYIKVLARV